MPGILSMPGNAWSTASKINLVLEGFQLIALSRPQFPAQGIWWKTAPKKGSLQEIKGKAGEGSVKNPRGFWRGGLTTPPALFMANN